MAFGKTKQAAADAVNTAKSSFTSVAGMAWKVGKGAALSAGILSFIAVTAGGGAAALGGAGFAQYAQIPLEGLTEATEALSTGATWTASKLAAMAGAGASAAATATAGAPALG